MKTEDFLRALRSSQILPDAIMQKLDAKVANTEKHVSPKSIAKYLIEKGFLSKYQARQLLAGELTPADDVQIQVSRESSQDTDELLRDLRPDPNATRVATDVTEDEGDDHVEVVEVDYEQTMQHGMPTDPHALPTGQGMDPLGAGLGFDSEAEAEPEADGPATSFAGKKAKKDQWESKWLFIGFTLLGLMLILGGVLFVTLFKVDSSRAWESLLEDFNNGSYASALTKIEKFRDDYPSDENATRALVMGVNCKLRIPYDSRSWDNVVDTARDELPDLQEELETLNEAEMFDEIRDELSVILPGTALGYSREGVETPDVAAKEELLKKTLDAQTLIDESAYVPTSRKRNPGVAAVLTELENNVAIIRRQIEMENRYTQTLEQIGTLTASGDTTSAFQQYFQLINAYPELQTRDELRQAVATISKREADLVSSVGSGVNDAEPPDSPVAATGVFGTRTGQDSIPGMGNRMVVMLIDGSLYGLSAATGEIVWRKFVGMETRFHPVWLDESSLGDVIAVDGRNRCVLRIDSETGEERWRAQVDDAFAEPYVSASRIVVTTGNGRIIQLDPEDGSAPRAAQIPQRAIVSAVPINESPMLYQAGSHSNIYVVNGATMECREVYYLGHRDGAVSIPPFSMSDHLLVAENGADYCKIHVLRHADEGGLLYEVQQPIQLDGKVSEPIVRYGRWGLVVSDSGDMRMLELNRGAEDSPVTVVASARYNPARPSRKFINADNGYMWNAAAGLRKYRIQKAKSTFKEEVVDNSLDFFITPSFVINDVLFHARRRNNSALVSISAVDAQTLKPIWRNDFAAPLAGIVESGDTTYSVTSQGDVFPIDLGSFEGGYFNQPETRGSNVVETLVFERVVDYGEGRFVAVGPAKRASLVRFDPEMNPRINLSDMQSPCDEPSCYPIRFGDVLLVATLRGQVFRINPDSGAPLGAPFQPELEPNVPVLWREPAVLVDGETFIVGNEKGEFHLVRADAERSLQGVDSYEHDARLVSSMLTVSNRAVGVCRGLEDQVVTFSGDGKLTMEKAVNLPGGYVSGPYAAGEGQFLVTLDTGETVCMDAELNVVWKAAVPSPDQSGVRLAGQPVTTDSGLVLAFETGLVVEVDAASGEVTGQVDLQQPLSGNPIAREGFLLFPGLDGTLHRVDSLSQR